MPQWARERSQHGAQTLGGQKKPDAGSETRPQGPQVSHKTCRHRPLLLTGLENCPRVSSREAIGLPVEGPGNTRPEPLDESASRAPRWPLLLVPAGLGEDVAGVGGPGAVSHRDTPGAWNCL